MMTVIAFRAAAGIVHLSPVDVINIVFYFALVLAIGFYLRGRDFFMAGREMTAWGCRLELSLRQSGRPGIDGLAETARLDSPQRNFKYPGTEWGLENVVERHHHKSQKQHGRNGFNPVPEGGQNAVFW